MHELSIAHHLVELAVEAAKDSGIKRVRALYLKLGVLSGVVKESLEFSFDVAIQGTPLEGARLVIEEVPVKVYCSACKTVSTLCRPYPMRCNECGARTGEVLEGREIELYALEEEEGEQDAADHIQPENC